MSIENILKEVDNLCTILYKNGLKEDFKTVNKVYNKIRKDKNV